MSGKFAYLFIVTILFTVFAGCEKDDPKPPPVDNTFFFNCKVNGTPWSAQQLTDPAVADYAMIDSMPAAVIRGDSLIIGAMAAIGTDTSAVIMIAKVANPANVTGTYTFSNKVNEIPGAGKAIGAYAARKSDFIAYLFSPASLSIPDGAQLKITKHADKKLHGEFNFTIHNVVTFEDIYRVTEGKFQNLKIR